MDRAIISRTEREAKKHDIVRDLDQTFHKIDELPFDFERRRMSVIVKDTDGSVSMVTKGALEEMLSVSNYVEYKGDIIPLTRRQTRPAHSAAAADEHAVDQLADADGAGGLSVDHQRELPQDKQ